MSDVENVRLPMLEDDELDDEQREAVRQISSGPRGAVIGPFVPLLRSPELMTRLQLVGEYLRFSSELDEDLLELTILVVAAHWEQQFEWGFHQPLALEQGVPESVVADIEAGRSPDSGRPELRLVADVARQLLTNGRLGDSLYQEAVEAIGERSLVEVIGTVGYYTTLALIMNVALTPPPAGAPRLTLREVSQ